MEKNKNIKTIGVLTSGGDAPGMNSAIRAVVRTALANNINVYGIKWGYMGLMDALIEPISARDVSGYGRLGGTRLGSARALKFNSEEGMAIAIENLKAFEMDGLVVIGGDGSLRGANDLHKRGVKVIGIPASIDNDIAHTSFSIGTDTALNTILDAVDKIRDTAGAHARGFVIEVMGNKNGYLALNSGIACGAELIVLPNSVIDEDEIIHKVKVTFAKKSKSFICVAAEGASTEEYNITEKMASILMKAGVDTRKTVLGHIQRGGKPSAFDRILATRYGAEAVYQLMNGNSGVMMGLVNNHIITTPLDDVCRDTKTLTLPEDITAIVDDLSV